MSERPPRVTLVVLAWNHWHLTERCLRTLRTTDLEGAEVVVVDNGSTDETPRRLTELDWVRVVTLSENAGFVLGNNAGIEAAHPDSDIVLLNNDLVFEQQDWLQRLGESARSLPAAGVVGCRLRLPDGRLLHAGTYMLPDTMWGQQIGARERDVGQYGRDREVEGVVFACAYLRRELIAVIGALSTDYQSYFEDSDYCLRARRAGYRTYLCGGVTLVHDEHGSTIGSPGSHMKLFQRSRRSFTRTWRRELEAGYRRELVWQSIMNLPTGYAMSCRALMRSLDAQGTRVAYRYVYGPGSPFPGAEPGEIDDHRLDVIRERRVPRSPEVAVVYGQGDVFRRNIGRRKIGFTMLEVDGFPSEWVEQANRMHEVWVPSEFNRRGFLDSGLERPIHRMPLGVDTGYFNPDIVGHRNPSGEYVFLAVFRWGERKLPNALLGTFSNAFSAAEPVRLLVKVDNHDPSVDLGIEIRKLHLRSSGGRITFLVNHDFPHYQMGSLYRSADCFVSAGRGEGWDMPLMEAMACGLPSIATDWGAHTEFVDDRICYPLRIHGTIPALAKCPYYEGFSWADPDLDHLRHLLRHVYENRDEARGRGREAAREMAARWTWEQAAARINERLEQIGD